MFRMNDSGRTTACIIVAVLILAILSPTDSRALSVDAIAFELNRSDMQVVVWMPLQTVDQLFDDRASVALSCDVHLGRCNAAENRAILQREVIVKGRYTMLLTVTGEGEQPKEPHLRMKASMDLEPSGFARRVADRLVAAYSKVLSYYMKALLMVARGLIS